MNPERSERDRHREDREQVLSRGLFFFGGIFSIASADREILVIWLGNKIILIGFLITFKFTSTVFERFLKSLEACSNRGKARNFPDKKALL